LGALVLGLIALPHADVAAQLIKDEQNCVNTLNKNFQKVESAVQKAVKSCNKDFAKGANTDMVACLAGDPKGKIAKAETKATSDETKKCATKPSILATDAANCSAAAKDIPLLTILFGSDINGAGITEADDKNASKCQQTAVKDAGKCLDAKLKEYNKCKKNALKAGGEEAEVTACVLDDSAGKIAKACDKIEADITKKCVGKQVVLATAFPHCDPSSAATVAACLEVPIECEACKAISRADDITPDCDLLDDGEVNASCTGAEFCGDNIRNQQSEECDGTDDSACPGNCAPDCTCPGIGAHKCVLDPNNSALLVDFGISSLPANPTGSLDIQCGAEDPGTGKAPCTCLVQDLDPLDLQPIGFICLTAASSPCDPGEIDCDGGNALDVDMTSEHSIGTCTNKADCEAQCAAFCAPDITFDPSCEGFCEGGVNDGVVCTDNSDCPGGDCPGPPGGHSPDPHLCGCSCVSIGGAPSAPGGLQCNLGVSINLEDALPCGTDPDPTVVGESCIPMTTQTATGVVNNANLLGQTLGPTTVPGVPFDCAALDNSITSGAELSGIVNFFDNETLGDLHVLLTVVCQ
jgi:hypothetical protein